MAFGGNKMTIGITAMMAVLVFSGLLHSAAAKNYTVGANVGGWILPSSNSNVYDQEFANTILLPGDELLFPFTAPLHNVYEIPISDLASCSAANPISKHTETNATITLTAGTHAYICEVSGHCLAGMHLQVNVSAAAPVPASTPATTPPTPAPSTKAPAPAPKAASPTPKTPTTPDVKPPTPGPGNNAPNALLSAPVMMAGSLLAGCAFLFL